MAKPPSIKAIGQQHKHTRIGIYGDPNSGKTTFAGSKGSRTLIIRSPIEHTDSIIGSGADEWVVSNHDDLLEVQEYARHEGYKEYDWFWLDSVSLTQDVTLQDIWQTVLADKPHRAKAWIDKNEYHINMGRLAEWFRNMIGCDLFHFGFTAHPFWQEFQDTDADQEGVTVERLMPWIQGRNMPQKVCGMMQMVGLLEVKSKKDGGEYRRIRFRGNEYFYGKDAFNCFKDGIFLNPTLPKLEEAVAAARAKKKATRSPKRTVKIRSKS